METWRTEGTYSAKHLELASANYIYAINAISVTKGSVILVIIKIAIPYFSEPLSYHIADYILANS